MSATSSADRVFDLQLDLLIGSRGEFTEAELGRGWRVYGRELVEQALTSSSPCWRPWGWWEFEARREQPEDDNAAVVFLAERGERTAQELAWIAERADQARPRIDTPFEHISGDGRYRPDVEAVELHEAVRRAQTSEMDR
jgi:hypothetical protein